MRTRLLIALWGFIILSVMGAASSAQAQDVMVVANRDVAISVISSDDLRAIFSGAKSRLADGSHAVPVTLKGGPAHEVFLQKDLRETPEEFRNHWRKAVFTGQGAMPRAFDSEAALLQYVETTPGALGYVSTVAPEARVKVLLVTR